MLPYSESKWHDLIVFFHHLGIQRIFGVLNQHWSMAGDVCRVIVINEQITWSIICASSHPICLDWCIESWCSLGLSWCFCSSVGSLRRITVFIAHALLSSMPSTLEKKALLLFILFTIIFSPPLLWTITASATFATLLGNMKVLHSEPVLSLAMIPPVQQWTSPDQLRPSPVQSSPSDFWTRLGPIPTFSWPGLNWPRLLWTSPLGPNRPEYSGGYLYPESTNRLINDCSLVIH